MASTFIRKESKPTDTNRTLVYTVTTGATAIVFAGTVANIDSTNHADHYITIEILKTDATTYVPVFQQLPVAYGGTSPVPKFVMASGEKVYITVDSASTIQFTLSAVERT